MGITVAEARRQGLLPAAGKKPSRKDRWYPYKSQVEYAFARATSLRDVAGWITFRFVVGTSLPRGESFGHQLAYEPETFSIAGAGYTPDWQAVLYQKSEAEKRKVVCYIETKGSEHQKNWRATIQLLRQASVLYPQHRWYLAEWSSVPGTRRREWRFWSVINGRRKRIGGNSHVQTKTRTRGEKMF